MREVLYKNTAISYSLVYKKVKNINLRIKSDGSITVSANRRVSAKRIDEFVLSKGKFILEALERFKERKADSPKPKEYVTGEEFAFLGKFRVLHVVESVKDEVLFNENNIYLKVKDASDLSRKKNLLQKWKRNMCKAVFTKIAINMHKHFQHLPFPEIKIRSMKSRWGSCRPLKAVITLNDKLIETPIECIEYVVLHEFCHFIHPNHSKDFYNLMDKLMPDRKSRKKLLEKSPVGTFEPSKA